MNIVFDLGGVVVRWEPDTIIAGAFDDPAQRSLVRDEFVGHADWLDLDRGTLSPEEAVTRAAHRTGLSENDVSRFLSHVPPALQANPKTVDLMYRLKARGQKLYCLSNMHHAFIDYLEETYTFWDVFSGMVISCRVNVCKPDPAIYRHLLDGFALDAGETVFIDDMQANVSAAAMLGIRGIRYENVSQCEHQLRLLGCM